MKEKDIVKAGGLERLNNELFGSFDPEDESWIIGGEGTKTISDMATFSSGHIDYTLDYDISFAPISES
jgi:hypothetical protein